MDEMQFKICHLYHDVLNLHGDAGNLICLTKRLEWRDIPVSIDCVGIGQECKLSDYDLVFIGGGQEFDYDALQADLNAGRRDEIKAAIEDGVSFLVTCGGYQIMGSTYDTVSEVRRDYVRAFDIQTVIAPERAVGNFMFRCTPAAGGSTVVGFENHSGKTYLGDGISPLGTTIMGHGNNGEDGTEGVHYKNLIGTYCHGPLLPKNPHLADYIIRTALNRKYGKVDLRPLIDTAEHTAHDEMVAKLKAQAEREAK